MFIGDVKKLNVWVVLEDLKVIIIIIIFLNIFKVFKIYFNIKIVENFLLVYI